MPVTTHRLWQSKRRFLRWLMVSGFALASVILCVIWRLSEERHYHLNIYAETISFNVHIADGLIMFVVYYPQQNIPRSGFEIWSEKFAPSWTHDTVGDTTEILYNDRHTFGSFGFGSRNEWGETFTGAWVPFWAAIALCISVVAITLWPNKLRPSKGSGSNLCSKAVKAKKEG